MHLQICGVLLSAVVFVSGCSKEDKAAETTGAFLSLADFTSTSATKLSGNGAVDLLSKSSWVRDEKSEDDSNNDNAITKCIDDNTPKISTANKSTLSVVGTVDATACLKAATDGESSPFTKLSMQVAVNLTCDGADFSALNGKSFSEIDIDSVGDEKCGTNVRKAFSNVKFELGIGEKTLFVKRAAFTKDGGACQTSKQDGKEFLSECIFAEYSNFASILSETEVNELVVLTANNIVDAGGTNTPWYESGKFDVTVNNFTGSLTYKGATTAPEYSLTDGAETKSGTLSTEAALHGVMEPQGPLTANLVKKVFNRLTLLR